MVIETQDFALTMPVGLLALVTRCRDNSTVRPDTAAHSLSLIDHTSLIDSDQPMMGAESPDTIKDLCTAAVEAQVAAVCVYPNQIPYARQALKDSPVKLAVVHNFPHGDLGEAESRQSAESIAADSCDEIDTVLDYAAFLNGDVDTARRKLLATSAACKAAKVSLKTILKATAYPDYQSLYAAATLACETGADFVKSCTGKLPKDGFGNGQADASTLIIGATIMQAVADYNKKHDTQIGVKISGGVKSVQDCEAYRLLCEALLGPDFFTPALCRFGASSLLANLNGSGGDIAGY